MAMCDGKGRFLWASCGQPGNSHDSTLVQSTKMWEQLHRICHLKTINLAGLTVPSMVLGDGAFPFRTYLMKRYSNSNLTADQKLFNRAHSRSRVIIENTFGILKARFRVLVKKCESLPENLTYKCLACVVLHNILVDCDEPMDYLVAAANVDAIQHQNAPDNGAASRVRDAITRLL